MYIHIYIYIYTCTDVTYTQTHIHIKYMFYVFKIFLYEHIDYFHRIFHYSPKISLVFGTGVHQMFQKLSLAIYFWRRRPSNISNPSHGGFTESCHTVSFKHFIKYFIRIQKANPMFWLRRPSNISNPSHRVFTDFCHTHRVFSSNIS